MRSYLFYDIETTGLNKSFDQVLQFAAIRTDLNFNEIKRYELKVKLNPDTIPSPQALLIHKISWENMNNGISELEAMQKIHYWFNEPGTISLGYNTLGFDDEFLRFSFFRNLLPPYTHQYANKCMRMDVYPITVMYFLFKNSTLRWPMLNDQISLKLENLNASNQFVSGQSHNAMVDVEATLALARQLANEKDMWEYLQSYFYKQTDLERINALQKQIALMIDGVFGPKNNYQCPAVCLGTHYHYKNQTIWLRLDIENFTQAASDTFTTILRTINKKPGEPTFILPFKERFLKHLSPERVKLAEINYHWIQQNADLFREVTDYHLKFTYFNYPETDVNASLYLNGFWSQSELAFCNQFHASPLNEKIKLLDSAPTPQLKMLALRLLGRNHREALPANYQILFDEYLNSIYSDNEQNIPIDYQGKKHLTPLTVFNEIEELKKQDLSHHDVGFLNEIYLSITRNGGHAQGNRA